MSDDPEEEENILAPNTPPSFVPEFWELLEKWGITTFTIIWRDPDNSDSKHLDDGEALWNLGAMEATRAAILNRYIEARESDE